MKDIQHIKQNFHSSTWAMPQGWDLGALGVPRGSKVFFSNMVMWHIQLTGIMRAEQNAIKIFTLGSNWWPWGEVKRSNIIKFQLQSQFHRYLYETLCVFSQIKDRKHFKWNFHYVAWVMPQGGTWGCWGVKNFNMGICDGAPSTVHSSIKLNSLEIQNVHFTPKQRKLSNIFYGKWFHGLINMVYI